MNTDEEPRVSGLEVGRGLRNLAAIIFGPVVALACAYFGVVVIFDTFGWWEGLVIEGFVGEYAPPVADFLSEYRLWSPWLFRLVGAASLYAALLLGKWADKQRNR